MPFKSKRQQRFMFAKMPELAKEFAEETNFKKLPEKVKKKKDKSNVEDMLTLASIYLECAIKAK